jgi:hypothetical protein
MSIIGSMGSSMKFNLETFPKDEKQITYKCA